MSDVATLRIRRDARGFALLGKGFRAFFLLAPLFALAIVPLWIVVLSGHLGVGSYLAPTYWHAHEMVFGFTVAVVAGFLLTAAGNWTKRETATGLPLLVLTLLWLAGRVVFLLGDHVPAAAVALVDLAFLPALAIAIGRVLLATSNRRNYAFLVVLCALWLAQLGTHLGAAGVAPTWQRTGAVVGIDVVILLILLIGGRIIPMFTRNATGAEGIRNVPWLDRAAIASMAALVVLDALEVMGIALAVVAGLAAVLTAARAVHWGSRHTLREPLLWVLHAGYLFVPIGLALRAVAAVTDVGSSAAFHALTVGAIGSLTLGMMARVSLGHTGRLLTAGRLLGVAFAFVVLAAVARVGGGLLAGAWYTPSLHLSATLWTAAFALYLVRLGPALFVARPDGKPG